MSDSSKMYKKVIFTFCNLTDSTEGYPGRPV